MAVPTALARPDIALASRLFDELKAQTARGDAVTRVSYGLGEQIAHGIVRREAEALGLRLASDAACNLYMTLPGRQRGPAMMIGSHLDSVPQGGNFDGAAGVLMGLSVLSGCVAAGVVPPRDITIMAIRAEESTWFGTSYVGSRAAFGRLDAAELDGVRRASDGVALGTAIAAAGGDVAALRAGRPQLEAQRIAAFIEPHIEQGPALLDGGHPVGLVTGIRGSFRHRGAHCLGSYAHSGTTPRAGRRDAVCATAQLVVALDALWARREAAGEDLAVTVGQFATDAAEHAFSKVAGKVAFALDIRSQSEATLAAVEAELAALVAAIAAARSVEFRLGPRTSSTPARMDSGVLAALDRAGRAAGVAPPAMPCGAGHDAAVFAAAGVPTGMILIRNAHGSHNPAEAMEMGDFAIGAEMLTRFCLDPPGAPQ